MSPAWGGTGRPAPRRFANRRRGAYDSKTMESRRRAPSIEMGCKSGRAALVAAAVAAAALASAPRAARAQVAGSDGTGAAAPAEATAAAHAPASSAEHAPARPPPLHVEYLQYGVALAAEVKVNDGASCPDPGPGTKPCILGSGGGLTIRGGYRAPGPWYFGGAYEFVKMDSGNLYRLGIFQQLRAEMRYLPDIGYRAQPYASGGLGGVAYGNEWGVETGGAVAFAGVGVEVEVSRVALVGFGAVYRPVLIAGWTDTAGQQRPLGLAQFLGLEFLLELRTEMGRR